MLGLSNLILFFHPRLGLKFTVWTLCIQSYGVDWIAGEKLAKMLDRKLDEHRESQGKIVLHVYSVTRRSF